MPENKKSKEKKSVMRYLYKVLTDIFRGKSISNEILMKNWKTTLSFIILVMIYISNRYSCQQKIVEIGLLNKQLTDLRNEAQTLSSELMGRSRQSQVQDLVDAKGLQLRSSDQPPFYLNRKTTEHGNQ